MEKGDTVQDFSALDQFEQKITLRQLLDEGRLVLYFYPKAMTGG
jgi:peroxiredoxin